MQVKTKFNAGDKCYVMSSNAITLETITDVKAEESATLPEHVTNTTEGNGTYDDDNVFTTPEELARQLVANYYAANPDDVNNPAKKVDSGNASNSEGAE